MALDFVITERHLGKSSVTSEVNLYDEFDARSENMCVVFGCGRHLTLQESLRGNKCSHCLSVLRQMPPPLTRPNSSAIEAVK